MSKRPICVAALILLLLLWCIPVSLLQTDIEPIPEDTPITVTGRIIKKERKEEQVLYQITDTTLFHTGIILVYLDADVLYQIGNTLTINGKWKPFEEPSNPGQFDGKLYYEAQGIFGTIYGDDAKLEKSDVNQVGEFAFQLKEVLSNQLELIFMEEDRGLIQAMILGDKTFLEPKVKNLYQRSGMAHLLAVSGLHVSILGGGLYKGLRKSGLSFVGAGFPAMFFLVFYGYFTGLAISTTRAVFMFLLFVVADMIGRSYDMLNAVGLSALSILLTQPLQSRQAGFLLSFGAVFGISFLYPILQQYLKVKKKWIQGLLCTMAIYLITMPILLWFYFEFSIYGIFLNIIVVPLMSILMIFGILALLCSFLFLPCGIFIGNVCHFILVLYETLGEFVLNIPGAICVTGKPQLWKMIVYYGCLSLFCIYSLRKKEKHENKKVLFVAVVLVIFLFWKKPSDFSFTMLDIGQGDSMVLQSGTGKNYLIDGGSTTASKVGIYRILPFLKCQGISKIDCALVTHTDSDHINGIQEILEGMREPGGFQIKEIRMPEMPELDEITLEFLSLAKEVGVPVYKATAGMCIQEGELEMNCLYPWEEIDFLDKNERSAVWEVTYGELSILLMGDLGIVGEEKLLEAGKLREGYTILKAGHHGSNGSSGEEFLDVVQPRLSLISSGEGNFYGHPHKETLERLENVGSKIKMTPETGAITIELDEKELSLRVFHNQ